MVETLIDYDYFISDYETTVKVEERDMFPPFHRITYSLILCRVYFWLENTSFKVNFTLSIKFNGLILAFSNITKVLPEAV